MSSLDGTAFVERRRGRSLPHRAPLAAALLALCWLLAASAPAGAAPARDPGLSPPARQALPQAQLYAPDGAARDSFGWSLACSGESVLIGAPGHGVAGKPFAGAAYVFTRSGGIWTSPVQLTAPDGAAYDQFGTSVALIGDTALVGAMVREVAGTVGAGAVYVFTRSGGAWTHQATLVAADGGKYDYFGQSVALSGETALIGATGRDTAGQTNAGAVYVFDRSGSTWAQQQLLTAPDSLVDEQFGQRVALSGETALVGAPWHAAAGLERAGAAYVFTRSGTTWALEQQLSAPTPAATDEFGASVALSGETALIGAPNRVPATQVSAGAAYVFVRSAGSWTQQAELSTGAAGDRFGTSVALSGETALIGAPFRDSTGQENSGAADTFTRSGSSWTHHAALSAPDAAAGDWFGWSVALSGDTAVLTAPIRDTAAKMDSGAAYVFRIAPTIVLLSPASGPAGTSVTITGAGFAGATAVTFNGAAATFTVDSGTQISATVPPGATSGPIAVTTSGGTGSSAQSFEVIPTPAVAKLSPASGKRGATVTVTGTGFGATRGSSSVAFGSKRCTQYVSWSATRIKCKVPGQAKYGTVKVKVTTAGGASNTRDFTVRR